MDRTFRASLTIIGLIAVSAVTGAFAAPSPIAPNPCENDICSLLFLCEHKDGSKTGCNHVGNGPPEPDPCQIYDCAKGEE